MNHEEWQKLIAEKAERTRKRNNFFVAGNIYAIILSRTSILKSYSSREYINNFVVFMNPETFVVDEQDGKTLKPKNNSIKAFKHQFKNKPLMFVQEVDFKPRVLRFGMTGYWFYSIEDKVNFVLMNNSSYMGDKKIQDCFKNVTRNNEKIY